jgi:hypothetical protein
MTVDYCGNFHELHKNVLNEAPMGIASNRSVPDLFSSSGREPSVSSPPAASSSPVISHSTETAVSSRHILPKGLDTAMRQLDDRKLERLLSATLEERSRRKNILVPEKSRREPRIESVAAPLAQGKLNAVRAAFKAGVTPPRIARQFGSRNQTCGRHSHLITLNDEGFNRLFAKLDPKVICN